MKKLSKNFYTRDPAQVAQDLLGCILARKLNKKVLKGMITETEAYYGKKDPASRAYKGKTKLAELMWSSPGTIFIYMVHNNWLFNIVTGKKDQPSAVLIRAIEPLCGIEYMRRKRKVGEIKKLTSGPGKFTQAFGLTKAKYHGLNITGTKDLYIISGIKKFKVGKSKRIGVSRDLSRNLRFYIKGNEFVSR